MQANTFYFREENNKILLTFKFDIVNNLIYRHYISDFELSENCKIEYFTIENKIMKIKLSCGFLFVLDNPKLLRRPELRDLRKMLQRALITKITNEIKSGTKLFLQKIKENIKLIISIALAIGISITSFCLGRLSVKKSKFPTNSHNLENNLDEDLNTNLLLLSDFSKADSFENENEFISENVIAYHDDIVEKYADMYYIEYETAIRYVYEDIDIINNMDTYELGVIDCMRRHFWDDNSIDKTPIVSEKTLEEKDKFILEMANIYGIYDEDTLATLIGINRTETGGNSNAFINYNNCGGIMDGDCLAKYKTFEIGAECFVRTFLKVKDIIETNAEAYGCNYNPYLTLEENMVALYNGASLDIQTNWVKTVKEFKEEIIENGILDDYIKGNKVLKKSK